jgi:hypothetical protein
MSGTNGFDEATFGEANIVDDLAGELAAVFDNGTDGDEQ